MDYTLPRHSKVCSVSGRTIQPGETYYSVVIDTPTGLERRDFSAEEWKGPPPEAMGFWRGKAPAAEGPAKPKTHSTAELLAAFEQLGESNEPNAPALRFVLALLLVRRKGLKVQSIEESEAGEVLVVSRPRSKQLIRVCHPAMTEDRIHAVENELVEWLAAFAAGDENPAKSE